jgi:hypothetical protein
VHEIAQEDMAQAFERDEAMSFDCFYEWVKDEHDKNPSTIRISLGIASNFKDVYEFLSFAQSFINKTEQDLDLDGFEIPECEFSRDAA